MDFKQKICWGYPIQAPKKWRDLFINTNKIMTFDFLPLHGTYTYVLFEGGFIKKHNK